MADSTQPDVSSTQQDEKDKKMAQMQKELNEKDAKLAEMQKKLEALTVNKNDANTDDANALQVEGTQNDDDSKQPPKTDVTLSLRGVAEFDQYPLHSADKFYFMASIKAPYFRSETRAPIDLVAVVDESGSMSGKRIELKTVQFIIHNLESNDRFGIVGYSNDARIVLPLSKMDQNGKKKAEKLAKALRASGGTALCDGLVTGVNMMRERKKKNDVASVMILTDGQANIGPSTAALINEAVKKGKVPKDSSPVFGYGYNAQPPPQMYNSYIPNAYNGNAFNYNAMSNVNNIYVQPPQQPPIYGQQGQMQQQQLIPRQIYGQQQGQMQQQQLYGQQGQMQQQQQQQQLQQGILQQTIPIQKSQNPMSQGLQMPNKPKNSIPQQLQQQPGAKAKKNDDDDEKEKDVKDEKALECTINTFGFGSNHNESLLESLAENGRGMYAFIENADMIADTFAECLGGLVSIIGQDLKIRVDALNDIEINQCLSKGYTLTVTKPRKIHTISIKNLQSEESRDLIFELKVPQCAKQDAKYPLVQTAVTYKNVVKNTVETLTNICYIKRIGGKQIGERNIELDVQYNRVLAANAMQEAGNLANNGKLKEARMLLTNAQNVITASASKDDKLSSGLVKDLQQIQSSMQSQQQYSSHGGKAMKMNMMAHQQQRSVQATSSYQSQAMYSNASKCQMQFQQQQYFGN